MPESMSVLFKEVLPGHEPSDDDLLKMLKDRAEIVAGFLDRITLTRLGEVKFMPNCFNSAPTVCLNNRLAEKVTHPSDGLSLQGFFMQVWSREDDGAKYHLIGFSRDGEWLEVVVEEKQTAPSTYAISKVEILNPSPQEIVSKYLVGYRDLLDFLTIEMQRWAEASRERHVRLQSVADRFVQEDTILKAMCAKPEEVRR
ncbi:hypothetical protein HZC53_00130 [Candidatus Uhrbacteria bacterium]|nr:hypothetical protein [Candidatus Uhrbacteria bacterium]